MNTQTILNMINNNEIEKLKAALQEEIYQKELKKTSGKADRYKALKYYFKYVSDDRLQLNYPYANYEYNNKKYTAFTDAYSLGITAESFDIKSYQEALAEERQTEERLPYFNIKPLLDEIVDVINTHTPLKENNLDKYISLAKSKGYKMTKKMFNAYTPFKDKFYLEIGGVCFNIALIEKAYNIIKDNSKIDIYCHEGQRMLYLKNDIGMIIVCGIRGKKELLDPNKIIEMEME